MTWQVCMMLAVLFLAAASVLNGRNEKRWLHDMQELTHIEVKDEDGDTIGHEFILICKKCGKVRKVRI